MARSPEGHAARSMSIKGQEELWIRIQANTFKNWASVTLSEAGGPSIEEDLETAFQDGTKLVALVETLQKRKLKHNKRPSNQHQEMENIQIALDAIKEDGITLINIGKQMFKFLYLLKSMIESRRSTFQYLRRIILLLWTLKTKLKLAFKFLA